MSLYDKSWERLLRIVSLKWVNKTEMLSTVLKPLRFTSLMKASEIHMAFMPKADSRISSPGTSG